MSPHQPHGHLNTEQAAQWLGKSRPWLLRHKHEIGFIKLGRDVYFSPFNLERYLSEHTTTPASPYPKTRHVNPTRPSPAHGLTFTSRKGTR